MKLSVIIPHFQGRDLLQECLNSLFRAVNSKSQIPCLRRQANYKQYQNLNDQIQNLEIIIIDNNSHDGSKEFLKELNSKHQAPCLRRQANYKQYQNYKPQIPNKKERRKSWNNNEGENNQHDDSVFSIPPGIVIKTIFNKTNLGFARAVNQGAKAARGDYLLVLNDDVRLADNWLANLELILWQYRQQRVAAFGGIVLDRTGRRVESLGLRYFLPGRAENIANGWKWSEARKKFKAWLKKPHLADGLNGAAVVYRRDAFLAAGGFDERFFAYLEDVDLALRLRERGWQMLFLPQLVAYHQGGATSRKMGNLRQRMTVRNWWWLLIKNYPSRTWRRYWWPILLERGRNFSYLLKTTPLKLWPATFWWLAKNLLELPTIWRTRKPLSWLAKK